MANAKTRRALGRGLSSLIPQHGEQRGQTEVVAVDIDSIDANPFQPRSDFEEEEIRNLADSIKEQGLLQAIIVRPKANRFQIVSGERRVRALRLLKESVVPCVVKQRVSDREMLELALVENIQREDLNDIEKAKAYEKLLAECGLSHEQLSARISTSRSVVTNTLRLLKLPEQVQEMIRRSQISMGHARALLALSDEARQIRLAQKIAGEGLSVREVEKIVRHGGKSRQKKKMTRSRASQDADIQQAVEKLQYRFGTAVTIASRSKKGGKIEIAFYSSEDFERILAILLQ
jgi:ParB family chromosome partitioning protein